ETQHYLRVVRERKKSIAAHYALPSRILDIAKAITECMEWQDDRKKQIWIYIHYESLLLDQAASRYGLNKDDILLLMPTELTRFMQGGQLPAGLSERRMAMGILIRDNAISVLNAATSLSYWDLYIDHKTNASGHELKGTLASRGNGLVIGTVRIVPNP